MPKVTKDDQVNSEIVSKFKGLDFVTLWEGRDKVDQLEKSILHTFLKNTDGKRVLEIGPGEGRLTDIIQSHSSEYVATDINESFLKKVKERSKLEKSLYVSSNLYHLPFCDNSFSTVVIVRVFNFISQPLQVMKELSRIIIPGGNLLISVSPKPSLSTLIDDLKYSASNERERMSKRSTITFSNYNMSEVHPASYPTFAFKRSFIRNLFEVSGFIELTKISSGLEDYLMLNTLPVRSLLRIGTIFKSIPIFPTDFFLLQKKCDLSGPLEFVQEIFQCPKCQSKLSKQENANELICKHCGYIGTVNDGIINLTFLPEDAKVVD